ncbi:MAG: DoxX family membrane protein [Proteobacteria bacterium]|nr:DoxX family membrane protein [Pseudomonadota bacterium]
MNWLTALLRIGFGLVFIAAGVGKIAHPAAFAQIIYNYQMVPDLLVNPMAMILPWVEVVCGMALVTNCLVRGAAFILSVLLLIFLGALWFNISRGLDVGCGCFSVDPQAKGNLLHYAVRDTILFAVGLVVLWRAFADVASRQASARLWHELATPRTLRKKAGDLRGDAPARPVIEDGTLLVGPATQAEAPSGNEGLVSPVPLPGEKQDNDQN